MIIKLKERKKNEKKEKKKRKKGKKEIQYKMQRYIIGVFSVHARQQKINGEKKELSSFK